jgi:hypothetical protein
LAETPRGLCPPGFVLLFGATPATVAYLWLALLILCQSYRRNRLGLKAFLPVHSDKIDTAAIECLEFAMQSRLSPAAACADFLRGLLADGAFTAEETDEITLIVRRILKGFAEPQQV